VQLKLEFEYLSKEVIGHPATTLLQAESVVAGERLGDWPVAITSQIQTSLASARLLRT